MTLRFGLVALFSAMLAGCATTPEFTAKPTPPPPRPKLEPKKPEAKPKPKPVFENVEFAANVFFGPAQSALNSDGRVVIDRILEATADTSIGAVVVTGHANSTEVNAGALAERRAQVVKAYLESKGIPQQVIFWEGKTVTLAPAAARANPRNAASERYVRVEIVGRRTSGKPAAAVADPQVGLVPVLFATNRKKTGDNSPERYFGSEEADKADGDPLTTGRALVRVPPVHTQGQIERPGWIRLTVEKMTENQYFQAVGIRPIRAVDPNRHFSFAQPIEELTDQDFRYELKKSLSSSKSRSALVYVHGYANSFTVAAFRAAQFTYDLRQGNYDVVPLLFSWPSDPAGFNYLAAKDRARSAGWELARFLEKVVDIAGVNVIHIVTHSMGAEVLGVALADLGTSKLSVTAVNGRKLSKFNQIILAAPDVRAQDFERVILPAVASGHRVTNYASSNDSALRLSKKANAGERAGDSGSGLRPIKGVETIDASAVNSEALGHAFFAESPLVIRDLALLMSRGMKPPARGLVARQRKEWTYWLFKQ
jgi:esterase/lipase superfamily enzyme/outer membrane protein OmpA-like peptidoglycan-associated protein